MKKSTLEMVGSILKAAITDSTEREEALRRLMNPKEKPDKQLTTKQACELAQVCPKTLFRWEIQGHLHATRATRSRIRWSRNELEKFLLCEAAEA